MVFCSVVSKEDIGLRSLVLWRFSEKCKVARDCRSFPPRDFGHQRDDRELQTYQGSSAPAEPIKPFSDRVNHKIAKVIPDFKLT